MVTGSGSTVTFTGAGNNGPFPFLFAISDPTAMTVIQNGEALDPEDYVVSSVNGSYANGGAVTLNAPCPVGQTLILQRNTPLLQLTAYQDNMPIPMKTFENGLDKLTEADQDIARLVNSGVGLNGVLCLPGGSYTIMPPVGAPGLGNGSTVIDVTTRGADPTGLQDSTAAIQAAIAVFSVDCAQTGISGEIYFPPGTYKISSPLILAGLSSANVSLRGEKGASVLSYAGGATTSMLILYGMVNGPIIEGLTFKTNGQCTYAVHLVADNAINTTLGTDVEAPGSATVTPGSMNGIGTGTLLKIDVGASAELVYVTAVSVIDGTFTATFKNVHLSGASVGGGPTTQDVEIRDCNFYVSGTSLGNGVAIGNVLGPNGGNSQVSENHIHDCNFYASGTGPVSAIVTLDTNNVGDTWMNHNRYFAWQVAINLNNDNFASSIENSNFEASTVADIRVGNASGGTLIIKSNYSELEAGAQFIYCEYGAISYMWLDIVDNDVQFLSTVPPYAMGILAGMIRLEGNSFYTPSASVVKVQINGAPVGNPYGATTLFSSGNYFSNATGWAPFHDSSGNALLPTYLSNTPCLVTSIGDRGGLINSGNQLIPLNNYVTVASVTSQNATHIAGTGIVAAGDTDVAVAFRNHANTGDVLGISKDTSDIVHIGGTAGVELQGPLTGVTYGPLDIGRLTFGKQTTQTAANFAFSAGWGTPTGVTIVNNSKDQAGGVEFTTGNSPSSNPTVTMTFADGNFGNSPATMAWIAGNGAAVLLAAFPNQGNVEF